MKRRLDTILLAAGLFTLSGAILCYNLATLSGEEIKSVWKAVDEDGYIQVSADASGNYLSEAAKVAIKAEEAPVEAESVETVGLLPPVVVPD